MQPNKIYKAIKKGLNKYGLEVKLTEFEGLYNITEVRENYKLGRMIKHRVLLFKNDTDLETATNKFNSLIKSCIGKIHT